MSIKEIFGKVKIYRLHTRVDNRGSLEYVFDENTACFNARETRIYSMPKEGTFFGMTWTVTLSKWALLCNSFTYETDFDGVV